MKSQRSLRPLRWPLAVIFTVGFLLSPAIAQNRHPIPTEHPRLLGSRAELQALAKQRSAEYQRVVSVARQPGTDDHAAIISQALVAAIEGNGDLRRQAKQRALRLVDGPIRAGHVTFGHDLALSALAYDLCFEWWTDAERERFHTYFNRTVDANVQSETHVFHNAWYGYKNWGIGLAGYASFHENPRSPEILKTLEQDFRTRAGPALELAGEGGGWAEGYYIHYWLYEWLFFCEVARRCEGLDYYALAPRFFSQRAVASMFEMYPGLKEYNSRRPVPMGDGGGRLFGGDRDKALSARRILVNHYRNTPDHQAVHAFNETTPRSSVGNLAYMDFLWRDPSVPKGDLSRFKLSHLSTGPGHVYARSSWQEDATYFFFKCSDRFTAHQHLDAGQFVMYRHDELAGDGGHYDEFGTVHDVNYHLRSIAHSTLLVLDSAERWPGIRAGKVTGNDGGQHHNWPHHNGATSDPADWQKGRALYDIADLLAFEDRGDYLYVAADATRAYSTNKLKRFTRQIVFLRPGTFVIFDRVTSTKPEFKKTWLLQAMKKPEQRGDDLVITHGQGRLFVQTVLPAPRQLTLAAGENLYRYDGQDFPPHRNTGPAPECRIEISPPQPRETDFFLHLLTATDAGTETVPRAVGRVETGRVQVTWPGVILAFPTDSVGGEITWRGQANTLAEAIRTDQKPLVR
jgi:hypothetical protein